MIFRNFKYFRLGHVIFEYSRTNATEVVLSIFLSTFKLLSRFKCVPFNSFKVSCIGQAPHVEAGEL